MYKLRKYNSEDHEQVTKLWIDVCVNEYGLKKWENELKIVDEFEELIVADLDGIIIGTIAYQHYNETTAEIKRLYVNNDYRGLGIANNLLSSIIEKIKAKGYKEIYLETWEHFPAARKFYEKNNFILKNINGAVYTYIMEL